MTAVFPAARETTVTMTLEPVSSARTFADADVDPAECCKLSFGTVWVARVGAPGATGPNEDAAAVLPFGTEGCVLAVADGVGGAPGGAEASRLAVRSLRKAVQTALERGLDHRTAVLDGIEQANRALAEGAGGATTIAVVHVERDTARPYHVGDSDVLVVGQRGKIKHQSIPHGPVGYAVEAGLLDEGEAMVHEARHVVTNVVGSAGMRIEIGPAVRLAPRDTVLLATDGLWDNLFLEEIVEIVRRGPLDASARRLVVQARERMASESAARPSKPDDLTFVLFRPRA
jgi:serine/threonine protein phosphatase PrpC